MDKINHCQNHNRFIPIDSEELTALELIGKTVEKSNELVDKSNNHEERISENENKKVSFDDMKNKYKMTYENGTDYRGKWFGLDEPTLSDEGMRSQVQKNRDDILKHSEQLESIKKQEFVMYEFFGAIGNGEANDSQAIIDTHNYANLYNLKVVGKKNAIYKIDNVINQDIYSDVDWTGCTFLIDESINTCENIFIIRYTPPLAKTGVNITTETKKIELLENENYLLKVFDDNTRVYKRYGFVGDGDLKSEHFIVNDKGDVLNKIAWDINATRSYIYKIPSNYITIKGGTFNTVKLAPYESGKATKRGIVITGSKVIIDGLEHNIEDTTTVDFNVCDGFLTMYNSAYIKIKNVVLSPRKYIIDGAYSIGSYDLGGQYCVNVEFDNINANTFHTEYWGVMGTNYMKEVSFKNSNINRIDVHKHLVDLKVENSTVGTITCVGFGDMNLNNITCTGDKLLYLRKDFGGNWNGDITISNVTHTPKNTNKEIFCIQAENETGYSHGYPCYLANNLLKVDNYKLISSTLENNNGEFKLIDVVNKSTSTTANRYTLPNNINVSNVSITTENIMLKVFKIKELGGSKNNTTGEYNFVNSEIQGNPWVNNIRENMTITIKNVKQENTQMNSSYDVSTIDLGDISGTSQYSTKFMPIPKISIDNYTNLRLSVRGAICKVCVKNSIINSYIGLDGSSRSIANFNRCTFSPNVNEIKLMFNINQKATFFTNCIFNSVIYNNAEVLNSVIDDVYKGIFSLKTEILNGGYNNCMIDSRFIFDYDNTKLKQNLNQKGIY